MNEPRINIVISTFLPLVGGAEKQALALGSSLRRRGYESTIITLRFDKDWPSNDELEGVPIIRVAGIFLGRREKLPRLMQQFLYLLAMIVMGWALWQRRHCYDVLHVYQLSLLTLPAALVCRLSGKPIIVAIRSAGLDNRTESQDKVSLMAGPLDVNMPWLQVSERNLAGGDLNDLERLGKPVVRFTHSLLQRTHATVVVLSSRMQDNLAAHDINLPNTQLIANGVDIGRFAPISEDIFPDDRAQVVVCVSRLSYPKGIDVLLQAWCLVHKQSPQAQLIIVGTGPLRCQLEHMAQALGIADNVEFAGLQSDITAQLHRGNLAVLPSRFEGMPNALLEAMACGLPAVATRVSGSEDIIQHRVNGLLVEPEDYQELAQALLILLGDPALARQYGHAARVTIEQDYSLEHITDLYIDLYQRIAGCGWKVVEDTQRPEMPRLSS